MAKNKFDKREDMAKTEPGYRMLDDETDTLNVNNELRSGADKPQGVAGVPGVRWEEEDITLPLHKEKDNKAIGAGQKEKVVEVKAPKPIGKEEIREAFSTLQKYQDGKHSLDERIKSNNEWWRLHNWQEVGRPANPTDPTPASAWLFNAIANKHADIMDNFPEANVLARAEDDKRDAEILSKVIPVVLEHNDFEQVYSDAMWRKEINGTAIFSVVWDIDKDDVAIRTINPLSIYWQPGINDIQLSRNVFIVEYISNEVLCEQYPNLKDKLGTSAFTIKDYSNDDNIDHSDDSIVVYWYYKRAGVLHFCKFVGDEILFASENEGEEYAGGFYEDGEYPFIFDTCFPIENSPFGFGQVDIGKDPQMYIDKLSSVILKNAILGARPRVMVAEGVPINEQEYSDATKDIIHVGASRLTEDYIRNIPYNPLQGNYMSLMQQKISELKETSGNRDVNQGSSGGGVTSGTAITALQESGNKLARDQLKSTYRSFSKICYMIIERMRQFYTEPRFFRITGSAGNEQYIQYDNSGIAPSDIQGDFGESYGERKPIFDIKVSAQRSNPFQKELQNQRAQELFASGYFNPANADMALAAIDMMQFDGKEDVRKRISENGGMYQQIQQLQQQVATIGQAYMGQQNAIGDAAALIQGGAANEA